MRMATSMRSDTNSEFRLGASSPARASTRSSFASNLSAVADRAEARKGKRTGVVAKPVVSQGCTAKTPPFAGEMTWP